MSTQITDELARLIDETGRELAGSEPVQTFKRAEANVQQSSEARQLEQTLTDKVRELQQKQQNGTLTQEEIDEYRQLQHSYRNQPEVAEKLKAEEALTGLSQQVCDTITAELGVDFAGLAAPSNC